MDWPSSRESPSFLCTCIPLSERRARKSCRRACESRARSARSLALTQRVRNGWHMDGRGRIGKKFKRVFCRDAHAMKRGVTCVGERIAVKEQCPRCLFKSYRYETTSSITDPCATKRRTDLCFAMTDMIHRKVFR